MSTITVIIPTLGRPTLVRALRSVVDTQLGVDDEVIVVGDGPTPYAEWAVGEMHDPRVRYIEGAHTRRWGAAQYDHGMALAKGEWCAFLPDDDYMPEGALDAIKRGIAATPTRPVHIFSAQMLHWGGRILGGSDRVCEVTASQLVVPGPLNKLWLVNAVVTMEPQPNWADQDKQQTFDHAYIAATIKWYGEAPVFHSEVISVADQQNNGRAF